MTVEEKTCQLATLYGYARVLKDEQPTPEWKQEVWKDGIGNIDEHAERRARRPSEERPHATRRRGTPARSITCSAGSSKQTRLGDPGRVHDRRHPRSARTIAPPASRRSWRLRARGTAISCSRIGTSPAREARALGYTNVYSPILDLPRDPRWGRVVETYSEDPYLTAELGRVQVQAMQANHVVSTVKHFAVYSVPKGGRDGTARTDPEVTTRELEMIYLRPFRAGDQGRRRARRDGGVQRLRRHPDHRQPPLPHRHPARPLGLQGLRRLRQQGGRVHRDQAQRGGRLRRRRAPDGGSGPECPHRLHASGGVHQRRARAGRAPAGCPWRRSTTASATCCA